MRNAIRIAVAALLVAGPVGAAHAAEIIVDFEEFAFNAPPTQIYFPGLITSKGVTISNDLVDASRPFSYYIEARGRSDNADPDGATLAHAAGFRATTTVTYGGGSPFDLLSIDLAHLSQFATAQQSILFTFSTAAGSSQETFQLGTTGGLKTYNPNRTGLTSFSMYSSTGVRDGRFQFDNVRLNIANVSNPVPEPATWAMMIVGFGAIGGTMRCGRLRATRRTLGQPV